MRRDQIREVADELKAVLAGLSTRARGTGGTLAC